MLSVVVVSNAIVIHVVVAGDAIKPHVIVVVNAIGIEAFALAIICQELNLPIVWLNNIFYYKFIKKS